MFNPNGSEYHNEFVEVFNTSFTDSISLLGFSISDGTGTDLLELRFGKAKIAPRSYGLIMDKSYFGNSAFYNAELDTTLTVFITKDNSIGSGGLSNSSAELLSLFDSDMNLRDSIRYELINKSGFSYERRHHFGGDWRFSLRENGTIGYRNSVDRFIETIEGSASYSYEAQKITVSLKNLAHRDRTIQSKLIYQFSRLKKSAFQDYTTDTKTNLITIAARDSINYTLSASVGETGQYQFSSILLVDTSKIAMDSTEFVHSPDRFPLWVKYIRLEKPQRIEFQNKSGFDLRLRNLQLKGSGGFKKIEIDQFVAADERLSISKHSETNADIFDSSIPFLYSKNGRLRLRLINLSDSLSYAVDSLHFADLALSLIPSNYELYNHKTNWQVNASKDPNAPISPSAFKLSLENNPFSPNADGYEDELIIHLNYNEYDLVSLDIYSFYGKHVKTISPSAYQSIGSYRWNGKDKNNVLQKDGVYLLLIKGSDKKTGKTIGKKLPIALVR